MLLIARCLPLVLCLLSGCAPANAAYVIPGRTTTTPLTAQLTTVRTGDDSVTVFSDGPQMFSAIIETIATAQATIHVEMYEFGRHDIAEALVDARARGVAVTVIVDPTVDVTTATATQLRQAGIDVVDYPIRAQMIDHVKLLIADGTTAIVGGMNWGDFSYRNHDFDTLLVGPTVANLERVFATDLTTCARSAPIPPPTPDNNVIVATTLPTADIRPLALRLIGSAHTSLDLALYVLTDSQVVQALQHAHDRGVHIRIVLDASQQPNVNAAEALRSSGITVHWFHGNGEKLHAKAAVADSHTVLFGSANWTTSGFLHNHEVDVEFINSLTIAHTFTSAIAADWDRGTDQY